MKFDVSYGRHIGPTTLVPTFVTIAPGWWRLECGPLAIEVDDQPTSGTAYTALVALLGCLILWSLT